jgi:hypothetical protein
LLTHDWAIMPSVTILVESTTPDRKVEVVY